MVCYVCSVACEYYTEPSAAPHRVPTYRSFVSYPLVLLRVIGLRTIRQEKFNMRLKTDEQPFLISLPQLKIK